MTPPLTRISVIPTCQRGDLLARRLDCLAPGVQTPPGAWRHGWTAPQSLARNVREGRP